MQVFFLYLEEIDEKLVLFKNNMKSRVVTLRVNCYTNCLSILINRSYSLFYHIYIYAVAFISTSMMTLNQCYHAFGLNRS